MSKTLQIKQFPNSKCDRQNANNSQSDALWNFQLNSDVFLYFRCKNWFLICFSGSQWLMVSVLKIQKNLLHNWIKMILSWIFAHHLRNACNVTSNAWFPAPMTLKIKNLMKLPLSPAKRKHLFYMEFVMSLLKKGKGCPHIVVMNRLIHMKAASWNSEKSSFCEIVFSNSNLFLPATNLPNGWWNFSPIPAYDQNSVLNPCRIWESFLLQEAIYNYNKTLDSPYDPIESAIHSIAKSGSWFYIKLLSLLQKVCFSPRHCALHWWGEHRDLRRFWLWYFFLTWSSWKIGMDQPRTEKFFQTCEKQIHAKQRST